MRFIYIILIFGFFIQINAGCDGDIQIVNKQFEKSLEKMDKSVAREFDKITSELLDLFNNEGVDNIRTLEKNGKSNFLFLTKKNYNNSVLLKILNLKSLKIDAEGL